MDAVDIALVDLASAAPQLLADSSTAWPPRLRDKLSTLAAGGPVDATTLAILDADVGAFLAAAINELLQAEAIAPAQVAAIGCHGQTVAHTPDSCRPTSLQLGDANVIAEQTGITTVSDFRRRDMAAGGQGAPLAPAFHAAVLRDQVETRVVLNLGGIANLTVLPSDARRPVIGFDTGPANCLMDAWCRQHLDQPYDEGGSWAASAAADPDLLAAMLADPYFALSPPKSTGTQYFSTNWLHRRLAAGPDLAPATVQATLAALTTRSIADAIKGHAPEAARILVCGGGAFNLTVLAQIEDALQLPVESTLEHGIDPRWMEAVAFAWLAQRTMDGLAGNLPSVTGASGPRILGAIHPA